MTDTTAPRTAAPDPTCTHPAITVYDGAGRLWACHYCQLRFYPACPTCVDIGHRNVEHPAGWVLTPLAPEVPPRRDGLLLCPECGHPDSHHGRAGTSAVGCWNEGCQIKSKVKSKRGIKCHRARTPEPPDSGADR